MTSRALVVAAVLLPACSLVANPSKLADPGTPAAPTGVAASPGNGQVSVTWNALGGDVARYQVHRGTAPGALTMIAEVPASAASYVSTALANGTTYFFAVASVDSAGTVSALSEQTSATPLDVPTVTLASPGDGASNVPVDAAFVVSFSHAMDTSSVTVTTAPPVDLGTPEWDDSSTFVTFVTTLAVETSYTVEVAGTDPAGNTTTVSFQFSTVPVAPTLDATTPIPDATLVPTSAFIQLVFSEPMDQASVTGATTIVPAVACQWEWIGGGTTATCRHEGLAASTTYAVEVGTGARDASVLHTPLAAARQFSFTTAAVPHTLAPTITASTPADGAVGVSRYTSIALTFNEAVDKATAQGAFDVLPSSARGGTFGWSPDGTTMTYDLPSALDYGTTVTWTMGTGLKCLGGISLAAPVTRSFRAIRQGTTRLYPDNTLSGYLISTATSPYVNSYLFAGDGTSNEFYRSFLTFSLASISGLTLVNSATLTVYQDYVLNDPYAALGPSLYAQSVDYGATFTQADFETPVLTYTVFRCFGIPRVCGLVTLDDEVAIVTSNTAANTYTANVTGKVERDRQASASRGSRVQFRLRFHTNTNSDGAYNYTRLGSGSGSNKPYLDVTYEYP